MPVTAGDVIDSATSDLHDAGNDRWSRADMLAWHNDGQREVLIFRPDASVATIMHDLAPGWEQTIPMTAIRLLDVLANEDGQPCRLAKREELDSIRPNWRNDPVSAVVKAWIYDERNPKGFAVWPPASAGAALKLLLTVPPYDCDSEEDPIALDEQYKGALVSYILHRAYRRDAEDGGNASLAATYYQLMITQLTGRTQAEREMRPEKAASQRKDISS